LVLIIKRIIIIIIIITTIIIIIVLLLLLLLLLLLFPLIISELNYFAIAYVPLICRCLNKLHNVGELIRLVLILKRMYLYDR